MKKSKGPSRRTGIKSMPCKDCGRKVDNLDESSVAVTCWRCVCKGINPNSVILSDLSGEEISKLISKK